jgi:flavin reductase (DIM6/NTAB) family NADH-FMN oxidoreductase RutF
MDFVIAADAAGLNHALFQVTHGLYVLTSISRDRHNGQCLDALMQVTNSPPRVAIGVGKKTLTHEMIEASGIFVVNVIDRLDQHNMEKVKRFGLQSGRKADKFAGLEFIIAENGAAILSDAKAFFECNVERDMTLDMETHTLYIGDVTRAGTKVEGEPLTYNEYRRLMKKGG